MLLTVARSTPQLSLHRRDYLNVLDLSSHRPAIRLVLNQEIDPVRFLGGASLGRQKAVSDTVGGQVGKVVVSQAGQSRRSLDTQHGSRSGA